MNRYYSNDIKKEKDFYMNLKGKSGCWNSFIVKEWDLKEK